MMAGRSTIERVLGSDLCAGCGACAHIAPERVGMRLSADGFLRPEEVSPLSSRQEQAVARVCPGVAMTQNAEGRHDHVLWGPIVETRSGFATDPDTRFAGSSGGVITALLAHLLASGEVDHVVETTADRSRPYANTTATVTSPRQVLEAAGSRYAPSAPLADLETALRRPGRAAFVGKPCDVAALRAMAKLDRRIDEKIPIMISFFCAGVPSTKGAQKIIDEMGLREDEVVAFRYRGNGWPGHATATTGDGRTARMSYDRSWGGILSKYVQFRCKVCPDGTGGFADVVCADAWHCDERGYPLFEERDGISLVVSRTHKGEALVRAAMAAGSIEATPVPAEAIAAMQPGQLRRKRLALARLLAVRLLTRQAPRFTGFNLRAAARTAGLRANLRDFAGTCRRLLRRRAGAARATND